MFYVMNNDKLVLFDDDLTKLQSTRIIMPQLTEETRETDIITEDELRLYPNKVIAIPNEYEIEVQDYETIYKEEQMPIYDENEEIIGYETITVEKQVEAGTHTEIRVYYTLALNPNFETEEAEKEKERIGKLECTKRVFVLMLEQLGVSYFEQIKPLIESNPQAQLEWELCVKLERSNPLLDVVGGQLGITPIQLDGLFKYANNEVTIDEFRALISKEEPPVDDGVTEYDIPEDKTPVVEDVIND